MAKAKGKAKGQAKKSDGTCFTIMPFGGYFDSYYNDIYCPAILSAGLDPKRADDLFRPSSIIRDIWEYSKAAKVVLADLTDKNPNVFYELGLAHAITKPAIMVTQSMDDVPFDLRGLRIIVYDKNVSNWGEILKQKITKSIKEVLASPDQAIPPTFLEVKGVKKAEVTPESKEILELKNELELLKNEVRGGIYSNPPSGPMRRRLFRKSDIRFYGGGQGVPTRCPQCFTDTQFTLTAVGNLQCPICGHILSVSLRDRPSTDQ